MTIPIVPLYPDAFDNDTNLYVAHDSLRVNLVEDYLPGSKFITTDGNISGFPSSGIITLTEQQSDIQNRAISFFYNGKGINQFLNLELLPGFNDVAKPKNITHVTQNVVAFHHDNIKDAIIAIEDFIGIKGTVDPKPLGKTMEGRINFLRKLVLRPRAWFTADKRIGIAPLKVKFTDLSFRNPSQWCWNFGDNSISACSIIPSSISTSTSLIISNADHTVDKTYFTPGIYDIQLKVSNDFGEDTITIPQYITVRVKAPDAAILEFTPDNNTQALISGVLHTRSNSLVTVDVLNNGQQAQDPVISYIWNMQDDLPHGNLSATTASYSIGGIYDIRLKVQTTLGAYRNNIFSSIINVIEKNNLWYMSSPDISNAITKNFYAYEFGLISETFKLASRTAQSITRDYTAVPAYAKNEFLRNNGFVSRNTNGSGDKGTALVYWTEGGSPIKIRFKEYTGFTDTWNNAASLTTHTRGWNWVGLNAQSKVYFLFGSGSTYPPNTPGNSPTNQAVETLNLNTYTFGTSLNLTSSNYLNGADELNQNVGHGNHGDYSVYRSCWKDHTGFIARNDGVGTYFRIKSFYRTEGTLSSELQLIRKLPDMPGSTKLEGELVPLNGGIYFFNNSGEIVIWSDITNTWAVGSPSANSVPFRNLQDKTISTFDNQTNTLVATSDGDRRAYLSFDYSSKVFLKFNESTLSFSSLGSRPSGEQFLLGVY